MEKNLEKITETACNIARKAGEFLKNHHREPLHLDFKGAVNLVTRMDRESEKIICSELEKEFPSHSILAEEGQGKEGKSQFTWIIDPLDGTTNYAHGLPVYCVSIALYRDLTPLAGVVYAPALQEMFSAFAGSRTRLNGTPVQVSRTTGLNRALLATGFPYDRQEKADIYLQPFRELITRCQGIRRWGAAALDLAYVAAGRFDGFWEFNLHPWDTAAGALLITAAGGAISDFSGHTFSPFMKRCLASNGLIHGQMQEQLTDF